jgi:histone acetyltransferase (RNA polymerase elongator complex component)
MKRVIVPFFISHQGCPHQCVFCDQKAITGSSGALPAADELLAAVREWRRTSGAESVEVAFYGGSFTLLHRWQQEGLLGPLQPLLLSGEVSSIRLSTRPDAVDPSTARFLRESGVTLVELGVQSMDDTVLAMSGRGHTARDTIDAFATLRAAGIHVGAQMMPGLPGESAAGAVASFRKVLSLQPDVVRIYPAVVLKGTVLARMYLDGSYQPLSLQEAVDICKILLHDAVCAEIPVIRVGLQPTDDLSTGSEISAGPYHQALRQLAEGERWLDLLKLLSGEIKPGSVLAIYTSRTEVSNVVGQKRRNIIRLENISGATCAGIYADDSLPTGRIRLVADEKRIHGDILRDLNYE